MNKLLTALIATVFAMSLSFNASAAKHMAAEAISLPKQQARRSRHAAKPAEAAKPADAAKPAKKTKKAKKEKKEAAAK